MSGRFVFFTSEEYEDIKELLREIGDTIKTGFSTYQKKDYYPGNEAFVFIGNENGISFELVKWGFSLDKKLVINGRSETVFQKPMFKNLTGESKCVIPATGFYEWKKMNPEEKIKNKIIKTKYIISQKDSPIFYMAGLYRQEKDGQKFVILTKEAKGEMREIHDRVPVILKEDVIREYLHSKDVEKMKNFIDNSSPPLLIRKAV